MHIYTGELPVKVGMKTVPQLTLGFKDHEQVEEEDILDCPPPLPPKPPVKDNMCT